MLYEANENTNKGDIQVPGCHQMYHSYHIIIILSDRYLLRFLASVGWALWFDFKKIV